MTAQSQTSRPFSQAFDRMRKEFDQFLEAAWGRGEKAWEMFPWRTGAHLPALDIQETGEAIVVTADIPGVDPQLLDIALAGNMLTISGQRPATSVPAGATNHLQERTSGTFSRSIPLPAPVDPEQVSANVHNGVVTIRLVKQLTAQSRKIHIQPAAN